MKVKAGVRLCMAVPRVGELFCKPTNPKICAEILHVKNRKETSLTSEHRKQTILQNFKLKKKSNYKVIYKPNHRKQKQFAENGRVEWRTLCCADNQ